MSPAVSRATAPPALPDLVTSIAPPAPIAPKLLEQANAAEATIAECEAQVGALALAEAQGEAGATENLAELEARIAAARAEHTKKSAAHKAALVADRTARDTHQAWIRTLPTETLIAGITQSKCPNLCHAGGCAIACGINTCMHPRRSGIPPHHQADRTIRDNHHAANLEIIRQEQENR
jgi:hypothetical protein